MSREDQFRELSWRPYVPVGQKKRQAVAALPGLLGKGQSASPIVIDGHKIANSFWGAAWCKQLEAQREFNTRLPRGRAPVRSGSVVHLQIEAGKVSAVVAGTEVYSTSIAVKPLDRKIWASLVDGCAGQTLSNADVMHGRLPQVVLDAIADPAVKLFPQPSQLTFKCTCADGESMCKHAAAVLYGVGARFDWAPESFFVLRGADVSDIVAEPKKAKKRKA